MCNHYYYYDLPKIRVDRARTTKNEVAFTLQKIWVGRAHTKKIMLPSPYNFSEILAIPIWTQQNDLVKTNWKYYFQK